MYKAIVMTFVHVASAFFMRRNQVEFWQLHYITLCYIGDI